MRTPPHVSLPRHALASNASDAAGNQVYDTAMSVIVVTLLGFSATQMGLLNALGTLFFLVLAIPIGMAVDAVGATRILALSTSVKVLLAVLTLTLSATGLLGTVSAMVIVALLGVATVASENAQTATVPRLVFGERQIGHLVARMASADRVAGVVAPGSTGILLVALGPQIPLGIAVALFALALAPALRLLVLRRPAADDVGIDGESSRSVPPRGSLTHGFVLLLRDRLLLATTLLVAAGNMGLAIGDSVEAILVLRVLDLGMVFYGALGTIAALAGLVASVLAPRIVHALPVRKIFVTGALVQSAVASLPLLALLFPSTGYVTMGVFSSLWAITLTITNIAGAAYAAGAVPRPRWAGPPLPPAPSPWAVSRSRHSAAECWPIWRGSSRR